MPEPVPAQDQEHGGLESPAGDPPAHSRALGSARSEADPVDGDRLPRQLHIRVSAWRPQLVHDVILPTQPVRDGEDDAIGSLRERYLLDRKSRMPESFKNPVLWSGCLLEISAAGVGGPLRWRDATSGGAGGATVNGVRAEISWTGGIPPAEADYVLCGAGDRVIARISVRKGNLVIKAADGVRCWYWAAAEPAASDCAGLPEGEAERFGWQLRDGSTAAPDSIRRDDHWLNGRAQRCELALDLREDGGQRSDALVFVDRITGWAIGGGIEQAQEPASANR